MRRDEIVLLAWVGEGRLAGRELDLFSRPGTASWPGYQTAVLEWLRGWKLAGREAVWMAGLDTIWDNYILDKSRVGGVH